MYKIDTSVCANVDELKSRLGRAIPKIEKENTHPLSRFFKNVMGKLNHLFSFQDTQAKQTSMLLQNNRGLIANSLSSTDCEGEFLLTLLEGMRDALKRDPCDSNEVGLVAHSIFHAFKYNQKSMADEYRNSKLSIEVHLLNLLELKITTPELAAAISNFTNLNQSTKWLKYLETVPQEKRLKCFEMMARFNHLDKFKVSWQRFDSLDNHLDKFNDAWQDFDLSQQRSKLSESNQGKFEYFSNGLNLNVNEKLFILSKPIEEIEILFKLGKEIFKSQHSSMYTLERIFACISSLKDVPSDEKIHYLETIIKSDSSGNLFSHLNNSEIPKFIEKYGSSTLLYTLYLGNLIDMEASPYNTPPFRPADLPLFADFLNKMTPYEQRTFVDKMTTTAFNSGRSEFYDTLYMYLHNKKQRSADSESSSGPQKSKKTSETKDDLKFNTRVSEEQVKNAFKVFGLSANTPFEQIKVKYKKMALQAHPDKRRADTIDIKELNNAYDVLKLYFSK